MDKPVGGQGGGGANSSTAKNQHFSITRRYFINWENLGMEPWTTRSDENPCNASLQQGLKKAPDPMQTQGEGASKKGRTNVAEASEVSAAQSRRLPRGLRVRVECGAAGRGGGRWGGPQPLSWGRPGRHHPPEGLAGGSPLSRERAAQRHRGEPGRKDTAASPGRAASRTIASHCSALKCGRAPGRECSGHQAPGLKTPIKPAVKPGSQ